MTVPAAAIGLIPRAAIVLLAVSTALAAAWGGAHWRRLARRALDGMSMVKGRRYRRRLEVAMAVRQGTEHKSRLRWGILSTGAIARTFAAGLQASATGVLSAVASRSREKAGAFAGQFQGVRAIGEYEALIADPGIDALYIATPHPQHAEWAIRAARAGKHVLVEKPMAINHHEACAMAAAAREAGVLLAEAFMYRCHPATAKLVDLLRQGSIGKVRLIQATFSFDAAFNPESRIFSNELAGGGILDVGCYTTSIARLLAGAAVGKPVDEPVSVSGAAHLGETGVDEWAVATLKFPGGIVAQLATGVRLSLENGVKVFGSEGHIVAANPYLANRGHGEAGRILLYRNGAGRPEEFTVGAEVTSFTLEADAFGRAVLAAAEGAAPTIAYPACSVDDSLGNMRTLDRWREAIGLTYAIETPAGYRKTTVAGQSMRRPAKQSMPMGQIRGLEKPVSRLIMGVDNQRNFAHAAVMFDDFFERGGNAFDTAWIYNSGGHERLLGEWVALRGVRNEVVLITKGAHTPMNEPRFVRTQLAESLVRLKTDHVDAYLLHRDNPQVPAGEFVDALNEEHRAGRIKAFGASNWSLDRIRAANDYAAAHGLVPFTVTSNQFSLARMIDPIWPGCVSAKDQPTVAWLTTTQTANLAWSSQSRGFFLPGNAAPDRRDNAELVRCWYSDDNFARLRRVNELAASFGVEPIQVALAWTLRQSFPSFALIGPRNVLETASSVRAIGIELTDRQATWLDTGAGA